VQIIPFQQGPFIDQEGMHLKEELFGECGAMEHILPQLPDNFTQMIKFLNEAFPDGSFLNAVQNDIIINWVNKTIIDLMRKKIIKPAMNYPYKFLLNRIKNAEKIDFMDFLAEIGYLTEKEKQGLIKRFDDNTDAKEKISQFVNL